MKGSVGLAGLQCRGWQGCLPPEAVGGLFLPLPAPGGPRHPRLTAASPPPLPPWSQGLLLRVSVCNHRLSLHLFSSRSGCI